MLNETFSMIFKHRDGEYLVCSSSNFEEVMSAESSYGRGLSGTFLSSILVCVQLCIALLFSLGSYGLWGNCRFFKCDFKTTFAPLCQQSSSGRRKDTRKLILVSYKLIIKSIMIELVGKMELEFTFDGRVIHSIFSSEMWPLNHL